MAVYTHARNSYTINTVLKNCFRVGRMSTKISAVSIVVAPVKLNDFLKVAVDALHIYIYIYIPSTIPTR